MTISVPCAEDDTIYLQQTPDVEPMLAYCWASIGFTNRYVFKIDVVSRPNLPINYYAKLTYFLLISPEINLLEE